MSAGTVAQLKAIHARSARRLRRWISRATSSLPVPDSPVIRTVEPDAAAQIASSTQARVDGPARMIPSSSSEFAFVRNRGSATRA